MIPLDDAPAAGGRRAAVREREEAVIASLRSLGTALDDDPDPAFRAATRARLVAMAAVRSPEPAPGQRSLLSRVLVRPEPGRSPVRRRLTAGLAGAALAVTALATLVAVATGASPGDPLYGLKRGTEQTQLALSGSDRGLTLLGFAHTRLTELAGLTRSSDAALAGETLRAMDDEATRGAAAVTGRAVAERDPAAATRLAAWGAEQSAGLAAVRPRLPGGAQPAADRTAALLVRLTDRGTALTTSLGCPGGPAVGGTDPLGPVPLPCAATPASTPSPAGGSTLPPGGTAPGGTVPAPATPAPAPGAPTRGIPAPTPGSGGAPVPAGTSTGGAGGVAPAPPQVPSAGVPSTGSGGSLIPPIGISPPATGTGGSATSTSPAPLPVGVPLPGTSTGGSGGGAVPGVGVCVPPVTVGHC